MPDNITVYLKPLLYNEELKQIRTELIFQNHWNNITNFINALLKEVDKFTDEELVSSFYCTILTKCKGRKFLNEAQKLRINFLYKKILELNPLIGQPKAPVTLEDIRPEIEEDGVFHIKNANDLNKIIKSDNKSENSTGYYNADGTVALKNILIKRVFLLLSAERRGLDFNLTDEDVRELLERKTCYYTGARFSNSLNYRRTIDRVDNSKGYIKGNVVACTHGINQIKNTILENKDNYNITINQLKKFASKL